MEESLSDEAIDAFFERTAEEAASGEVPELDLSGVEGAVTAEAEEELPPEPEEEAQRSSEADALEELGDLIENEAAAELEEPEPEPEPTPAPAAAGDEFSASEIEALLSPAEGEEEPELPEPEPEPEPEPAPAPPPSTPEPEPEPQPEPIDEPAAPQLPPQLQQAGGGGGLGRAVAWGLGGLLCVALLVIQYGYWHRDVLAADARLRPSLELMCGIVGCELPLRRAPSQVSMADHTVQSHHRYEGALMITATLVNEADFDQPYPAVEVVMRDLNAQVVARRRFNPGQYLAGAADEVFRAGGEAHLLLEVVDPGNRAVGFEFNFH